jgi:hypothetical protein
MQLRPQAAFPGFVLFNQWHAPIGAWKTGCTDHERRSVAQPQESWPRNIAMLRRLALNLAKLERSKGSMKGKLKRAGWNDTFLALAQFGKTHMR